MTLPAIDETGKTYGRLTVLSRAGSTRHRVALWLCRCECAAEVVVSGHNLRNGTTQSCGCLQREMVGNKHFKNELGNQYGKLTVLSRLESKNGAAVWLCHCECGNEVATYGYELRRGHTQSCGCLSRLPFGRAAFNALIFRMERSAKKRGYVWALTEDQVERLTSQPCYYCDTMPTQGASWTCGYNGVYLYNGLDRVDNEQGYTIDNVVPACGRCNEAKNNMTQDEFKAWACRIYEHFGSKE